ncbi:MAG: 50S ribosome-binding GTPase [Firmicutes bacterium]|nr:50S ribosome-binding GTPase [Bacillota bacterium]
MNINWFPGHMTKSLRMMEDVVPLVDAIVYVLDARAAFSCLNPTLDDLIKNKPICFVINKSDLVEPRDLATIKSNLEKHFFVKTDAKTDRRQGAGAEQGLRVLSAEKLGDSGIILSAEQFNGNTQSRFHSDEQGQKQIQAQDQFQTQSQSHISTQPKTHPAQPQTNPTPNQPKPQTKSIITLNAIASRSALAITTQIKHLCAAKIQKYANRQVKTTIRAMVIGIPNSGKSTLINNLYGSAATTTGNKAGVTRGKQWIKIDNYFEVLDTPGTLYPKLLNQRIAKNLAFIGSINDDILDKTWLSLELIKALDQINPLIIGDRYKIEAGVPSDRLEMIAKKRGMIGRGGVVDIDKGAVALIDDFRKGRLGKIALETDFCYVEQEDEVNNGD